MSEICNNILDIIPAGIYWKDLSGKYLGCNKHMCDILNLSHADIVGKTDYDLIWQDAADSLHQNEQIVIKNKVKHEAEEISLMGTNEPRVFLSTKVPLYNKNEEITGIMGVSIDITDRKKQEQLKIKEERDLFTKTAQQLMHDIRSPISSLAMLVNACKSDIAEPILITIHNAVETINSIVCSLFDKETRINLTFPKTQQPNWLAPELYFNKGDTVVILDDDNSIHGAWKTRFNKYVTNNSIKVVHFTQGEDAIAFINNFTDKNQLVLLSDFELLEQKMNGLDIIQKTKARNSILVTSHHANKSVLELAMKNQIKILPKQLASVVPITINDKPTDIVLIDDDEIFVDSLVFYLENKSKKIVARYLDPIIFLAELSRYGKNTKIFMDNNFKKNINGFDLAKQLHEQGYTNLYMLSGKNFTKDEIPDYLTVLLKTDIDKIHAATQ
ncbi:MAG: sensory box sensor histidine kinase/response regulator [uncultured bacterium]|nr:MAG: sensory box sensor histidine kinase/response regulator [uncultured bacterium]